MSTHVLFSELACQRIRVETEDMNTWISSLADLIRRILKARAEAGFSEDLWDITLSPSFVPSTSPTPTV